MTPRCNEESKKFNYLLKKSTLEDCYYNPLKKTSKKSLDKSSINKSHKKILNFVKSFSNENINMSQIDLFSQDNAPKIQYKRSVNTLPVKILDAPNLQDDFYFNLVDWSSNNYVTIGLLQ